MNTENPENTENTTESSTSVNMVQALAEERDQFKEKWARSVADLENYRRRVQKEAEEERKYGAATFLRTVLPGFDNLQRAILAAKSPAAKLEDLVKGVEMVSQQFETLFAGMGAVVIKTVGEPFDPNRHEAITQVPSADYPPMTVIQEVERGFTLHDRVIRPAKVIVSAASAAS
ncbi:GrpE protein [Planctopirus limnophila DSM 3776]|uniref:Protein GrpE n=1 Tax=Planctopirus limnophila (strain ATCC 43296 / DSM 3776 / IFAM 1008 / Mu 290) TaxID=521674 RepID=D5SS22_PLAL2|nr:nucleotide exchange factor GrpE [Planctopirus limnophila]ADG68746.1 GrpE protein [Planctopirus limnophila DSM 3776]